MYCPKCNEKFEEGSRRFCPADGSRLISESAAAAGGVKDRGIFANLFPKFETSAPLADRDPLDSPHFVITEAPSQDRSELDDPGGDFFVLDNLETEHAPERSLPASAEVRPPETKLIGRKVNPYEVPAGHVELGGGDRLSVSSSDFREDDPQSFVGRTVKGRYFVTDLLGGEEGSFAYLADDKLVADKKVLVRILLDDEPDEIMRSILDEERVSLSHFSHPNIARLIDSGQFTDGIRFLISEYFDALSVADILGIHGMIDGLRAARIVRQVAYALNEVHQEGILHRDLRLSNIIISPVDGEAEQAILVNFGASNGGPTRHNLAYKAPEVLDGRISTISSDIFSLAVAAFEMLTGCPPFKGTTTREVIRSQYAGLEESASGIRPELPARIDAVFEKALSFAVAGRYAKARDFGDAFFAAFAEPVKAAWPSVGSPAHAVTTEVPSPRIPNPAKSDTSELAKAVKPTASLAIHQEEPAWTSRSAEPQEIGGSHTKLFAIVGTLAVIAVLALVWYFAGNNPAGTEVSPLAENGQTRIAEEPPASPTVPETETPPQPRNLAQPPNTSSYENNRQNLKGDLLRNFVGFTMYYPKDWKMNGPQESVAANTRGKFLDISRPTEDGRLKEQMLVSYYPSNGTFSKDSDKFPLLVKETNDTLKKLLPGYQMVSEGEIKLNGDWRAYEVKFQGSGTSSSGGKIMVWGRRLFIPAERPGVRDGFEITMLATSAADEVHGVDDVGVHGELASILNSFEPSQNF